MYDSVIFVVLVGAWLVVLVPIMAKHRQEVRRTADAALATRVLYRGDSGIRLAMRSGSAAGHPSDPYWTPEHHVEFEEDPVDDETLHTETDLAEDDHPAPQRSGRGGFDPHADAMARRARAAFRQRVTVILLVVAGVTLVAALVGFSALWWPQLLVDLALVGYLAYLRRQTRIEQDVRERRLARMGRARLGVDSVDDGHDEHHGAVPKRLRRPGAVVLEIDDEDPAFDELDTPTAPVEMELPRASGQ